MKQIKGEVFNIKNNIIGKVTLSNNLFKSDKILICEKVPMILRGVRALIMKSKPLNMPNVTVFVADYDVLEEDDIVSITLDGFCNVIWEPNSNHNAFYLTDFCNSKCIMCPQPMKEGAKNYFKDNLKLVELIDFKKMPDDYCIGITGGEPTLNIPKLAQLLYEIKKRKNNAHIHILTNARRFCEFKNLAIINSVEKNNLTYGIPLYSNIAEEHDYIVGAKNAFSETITALHNLAKTRQKVEIRIVVLKQNYKKLIDIAEFIYRNLPFVTHVALMSMEYTGCAKENFDEVFVDPLEYQEHLYKAVKQFVRYNIKTSVYNTPLCLLDRRIWEFGKDSISTWKKTYLDKCKTCTLKSECSGVFATSFVHSDNIKPA